MHGRSERCDVRSVGGRTGATLGRSSTGGPCGGPKGAQSVRTFPTLGDAPGRSLGTVAIAPSSHANDVLAQPSARPPARQATRRPVSTPLLNVLPADPREGQARLSGWLRVASSWRSRTSAIAET